ncbi:3-isopropylmalate dehydratase small subunit [Candidatus Margulisiibacteriota bacterium]
MAIWHTGKVVPFIHNDINTDDIAFSHVLKRVQLTGFEKFSFLSYRYKHYELNINDRIGDFEIVGELNPDCELNDAQYKGADIFLTGSNFGCGSSREHAVWAMSVYKVIIATKTAKKSGFADIFRGNATNNGILTIELSKENVNSIQKYINNENLISIDLENKTILMGTEPSFEKISFDLPESIYKSILSGKNVFDVALEQQSEIDAFVEKEHYTFGKISVE